MMVMTAKFNFKKILMLLGAAAAILLSMIFLMGGNDPVPSSGPDLKENSQRIRFLKDCGWEVKEQPVQEGKVKMPKQTSAVYERYNNLQKSQGYDLSSYAGKKAMRYVYEITNYPGAAEPIFATLLIHDGKIIGGDITDTSAGGKIRGLRREAKMPSPTAVPSAPAMPAPTAETQTAPEETH